MSLLLAAISGPAAAQVPSGKVSDPEKTAAQMITPAAERSIERGLAWLASRQRDDGSFGTAMFQGNTGVTALGGMAFMSAGSTPGRGPYGRQINRAIDYLLANAQPSGFINFPRGAARGPMYGHGFATLFLAECDGMSPRAELRQTLAKAVKLIVNTQNKEGGWRYNAEQAEAADVSVTVCEVMALRAARNAGLHVPKETFDRCTEFVKRCQNPDGGFRYMLSEPESGFPRSAAALVALNSAFIYRGAEMQKGIDYLMQFRPQPGVLQREMYFEYGHYYAVQAMWQVGGDAWNRWYPACATRSSAGSIRTAFGPPRSAPTTPRACA